MKTILPAVVYFVVVILIAHFFAPPKYDWTRNTISDLGSQGHRHRWIMQAVFIGFGALLAGGLILKWRALGRVNPPDMLILAYGLSILMTGIFCAAPLDPSFSGSATDARLHSVFATVAGVALSLGILWYLFISPSRWVFHLTFLTAITGLSMLFGLAENGSLPVGQGIIQRVLYLTAFVWLAFL